MKKFSTNILKNADKEFKLFLINKFDLSMSNITDIEYSDSIFDKYIIKDKNDNLDIYQVIKKLEEIGYKPSKSLIKEL